MEYKVSYKKETNYEYTQQNGGIKENMLSERSYA